MRGPLWRARARARDTHLCVRVDLAPRSHFEAKRASELQLRRYLFAQQCRLLLRTGRPAAMATRALEFAQGVYAKLQTFVASGLIPEPVAVRGGRLWPLVLTSRRAARMARFVLHGR